MATWQAVNLSAEKPDPFRWLSVLSAVVTIGGLLWGASDRNADLRHETEARVVLERRVESLEAYRGDTREILAALRGEVGRLRDDIADLKKLLGGGRVRLAKDE